MTKEEKIKRIYEVIWTNTMINQAKEWFKNRWVIALMIWDVWDYHNKSLWDWEINWIDLWERWLEKRQPIENQSDECIDYVYNLIK